MEGNEFGISLDARARGTPEEKIFPVTRISISAEILRTRSESAT